MATRSASPIFELLLVFFGVFALQFVAALAATFSSVAGLVGDLFVLSPPIADKPWTVVTSVYAHADVGHLLSNSIALVLFGWPVARATTALRFHAFFLLSGALAGVVQVLVPAVVGSLPIVEAEPTGVLGASGGVFALLGYLLASNRLSSSLASAIIISRWMAAAVFVVVAVVLTLATASPGVALIAHFVGLLFGLLAGGVGLLERPSSPPETESV